MQLHRHQLVRLGAAGWRSACAAAADDGERDCLVHWARHDLPLVVTRQGCGRRGAGTVALGLAAPLRWQRRRIAFAVEPGHLKGFDEFPFADRLTPLLAPSHQAAWQGLCAALASVAAPVHVYGSHGWQLLSGLTCVHPQSDIDLWAAVADARQADAVAALLAGFDSPGAPRLDGELLFGDGRAVAWREWQAWRAGRCGAVLVKSLDGAELIAHRAGAGLWNAVEAEATT